MNSFMGAAMSKIKICCLFMVGMLFLSTTANARVCFLAGAENDEMCLTETGEYNVDESCPDMVTCAVPDISATSCTGANGVSYYRPEDCCSDGAIYEVCANGQKCMGGAVCNGLSGGNIVEYCEVGYCGCDESYKETCSTPGLVGVGEACNGKYQACQCDTKTYHTCDSDAKGSGGSCRDDNGTSYKYCTCPTAGNGDWVSDPDTCCGGVSETCTNQPNGSRVYKCSTVSLPDCVCGYAEGKGSCKTGCTDSTYEYVGNIPAHVTCVDSTDGIKAPCGNDCRCENGYWDYTAECTKQNDNVCADLGYTDTSCSGKWIGCPFNPAAKKCIDSGDTGLTPVEPEPIEKCSGYPLSSCPENVTCERCLYSISLPKPTYKYKAVSCADGYATKVDDCGDTGSQGWYLAVGSLVVNGEKTPVLGTSVANLEISNTGFGSFVTDYVDDCRKCVKKACLGTQEDCFKTCSGTMNRCYSGDDLPYCYCKPATTDQCASGHNGYNCTPCGGSARSSSASIGNCLCLRCNNVVEGPLMPTL